MAMELVKEPLRINRTVGEESLQFSVQGDVIIPDAKPDLLGVLSINSEIVINERDVLTDKVVLGGVVNYSIIYLAKDEERPIRSLSASVSFKEPMDIPGAKQGMLVDSEASILNTEFEILNERKIVLQAIAQLEAAVSERVEENLIIDTMEEDNVQSLRENIEICQYVGQSSDGFEVKDEAEIPEDLPPIFEILKTDARITKEIKISDNKIILRGDVNINTLYSADDEERTLQVVEHSLPFTQFVDVIGVDENAFCDVNTYINDVNIMPEENESGETRILKYKISIDLNAKAFVREQKDVITDMYSPESNINLERQEFTTTYPVNESENEYNLKENVQLPENHDINKVSNVSCKPAIIDVKVQDEKVTVSGAAEISLLYSVGEENTPATHKHEIPFENTYDIKDAKPDMKCKVNVNTVGCSYEANPGGEVSVKAVLKIEIKLYKNNKIQLVQKAESTNIEDDQLDSRPSMILYFVQRGDTLWKIGKKFRISLEQLIKINSLTNPDVLAIGQQILIPKKQIKKVFIKK